MPPAPARPRAAGGGPPPPGGGGVGGAPPGRRPHRGGGVARRGAPGGAGRQRAEQKSHAQKAKRRNRSGHGQRERRGRDWVGIAAWGAIGRGRRRLHVIAVRGPAAGHRRALRRFPAQAPGLPRRRGGRQVTELRAREARPAEHPQVLPRAGGGQEGRQRKGRAVIELGWAVGKTAETSRGSQWIAAGRFGGWRRIVRLAFGRPRGLLKIRHHTEGIGRSRRRARMICDV